MSNRSVVIAGAVVLVVIAGIFALNGGSDDKSGSSSSTTGTAKAPNGALTISFAYSPEKEDLVKAEVAKFNASGATVNGKKVFVQPVNIASGDAETKIAHSTFKPTVWSPASSFWGRLANYEADKPLTAADNPSLVRTPLVIAMWKQLADAYGYPKHKLGYKQLGELAQHGWSAVGKPQFGAFKFVHTNPDFSTSGLSEVAAQYYAAAGKSEGLTVADVTNPKVRDEVAKIENSIVHYGDTTLFVEDELAKGGLGYASAAAIEEATLIDFNRKSHADKLVAIYPSGGTFYSDSPLMTLNAPWVTPAQKAAARQFTAFLGKDVTAQKAGRFGFRPADPAVKPAGLVTAANGADPAEPTRVLTVPEPDVLAKIKAEWRAHRKPANVMVVFDNSGSMGAEDKLNQAKQGLKAFFAEAAPQDRIGLTKFSTDVTPLVPIAPMTTNRAKLEKATDELFPEEDTRLRDAIVDGVQAVQDHLDKDAINAVVVLTDGQDTASGRSADQAVRILSAQGEKESGQIRVFTIAYGSDANTAELARYAQATGGKPFTADTSDIEKVYRSISSFF